MNFIYTKLYVQTLFLMMNQWGWKHVNVEDAQNWIKALNWKVCISFVYVT